MLAREGYPIIGAAAVVAALLVIVGLMAPLVYQVILWLIAGVLLLFTLYFFRDPRRTPPADASKGDLLLAPADGKVVVVQDVEHEPLYLDGPARQVSIFLSPLNVHVNRVPADGQIEYVNYFEGDYLVAWHPKASEKNERSEIGLRHPSGAKILFKQIAGALARRIVYHLEGGETVRAGDRFGIVKFGSRMDVLVPPHVEIEVEIGQRVSAGLTILGRIPQAADAAEEATAARETSEERATPLGEA